MKLDDGLQFYKKRDAEYWLFTLDNEQIASDVLAYLKHYDKKPTLEALNATRDLLIRIEQWKMLCVKTKTGNAQ